MSPSFSPLFAYLGVYFPPGEAFFREGASVSVGHSYLLSLPRARLWANLEGKPSSVGCHSAPSGHPAPFYALRVPLPTS